MRLAVVSPFVDCRHGTERALAEQLERLARDYHCEVHLYAQRVEDLTLGLSKASGSHETGSIIWHKVPSIPGPHLLQFVFWLIANHLCRGWDRRLRGLHFDLVLSPGINCFDADLIIVHALFHRLSELAHQEYKGSESDFLHRFHRFVYYSLLTWLERRIYTSPRVFLAAVSQRTAALLNRYFHREDARVIANGVDTQQFSPERRLALRADARLRFELRDTDVVFLLIGNDWRTKGVPTILSAMAASPHVPLFLLVAGRDAMARSFFRDAEGLGLKAQCRWEAASVDAIDLYAAADAYVSPTLEDAFALPPLEAMACGLPVITSVNNGGSQIITENVDGIVVRDPADSTSLAQHLKDLAGQPDFRLHLGSAARQTSLAYTWDRNAAALWECLKEAFAKLHRL